MENESSKEKKYPGYPSHPKEEDIYNQEKKLPLKGEHPKPDNQDMGLDVPGAELDDAGERIGEEDEENNYYSLGGDAHNDLEEDDEK